VTRRSRALALWILAPAIWLASSGLALAAPDKKKKPLSKKARARLEKKLAKASKKLGVPVEALAKVGGHRVLSRRPGDLQGLCVDLHRKVDARNLPILLRLVSSTKLDKDLRFAALALISVYALEGDSEAYLGLQTTYRKLYRDAFQKIWEDAADQNRLLLGWFDLEQEVQKLFSDTYRGKHYRKAQRAYRAVLAFRHPELREGVAQEALREALAKRSRFGIKERQLAVRECGRRGAPLQAAQLAELMHADGTVAVACAQALADLGDASVLPSLRKVGRTSSHALRIPVLLTRGKLQDASLVELIGPTFDDDHARIRAALIQALIEIRHEKVDRLLAVLSKRVAGEAALERALDLGLLRRGDPAGVPRLSEALEGDAADARLARQVLAIPDPAANLLVTQIVKSGAKPLQGLRPQALAQLSSRKLLDPATVAWVGSLCTGKDKTPLRLQAAAVLVQAGAPKARAKLREALKDFKVVKRVDVKTPLGKARRFNGSHLDPVCRRWAQDRAWRSLPVLARWLDPPRKKGAKDAQKDSEKEQKKGDKTRTRAGKGGAAKARQPARPPKFLRHAFVRREAVRALGKLLKSAQDLERGKGDKAWPAAPPKLPAWRKAGLKALDRALGDSHALVQRAAVRALAKLAGQTLEPGASLAEEAKARQAAEGFLAR
jgi:hypothetical protein